MLLLELLLIFLITLGFSVAVVFSKVSLNLIRPERFAMIYITGAASVTLLEFSLFRLLGKAPIAIGGSFWILLLAALFGAFAYLFGYVGMRSTHAGVSSTIFNLQGPLIALIGALVFSFYPGNLVILGLGTAVLGLVLMGYERDSVGKFRVTIPFVLLCLSPLFWALEWISFDFVSSPAPVFLTFILYLSILLILIAVNVIMRPPLVSSLRPRLYALIGGFFSGIANGSYGIFITYYGSTLTGIVTMISVPVSLFLVVIFLKEKYSRWEIMGISLVCLGLVISTIL